MEFISSVQIWTDSELKDMGVNCLKPMNSFTMNLPGFQPCNCEQNCKHNLLHNMSWSLSRSLSLCSSSLVLSHCISYPDKQTQTQPTIYGLSHSNADVVQVVIFCPNNTEPVCWHYCRKRLKSLKIKYKSICYEELVIDCSPYPMGRTRRNQFNLQQGFCQLLGTTF